MSFIEVMKAIREYSLSLVLSAIVIYTVIKVIKIQLDKFQTVNSRKNHDKALELRDEIGEKVYAILNTFIQDHHGIRLQVIEFTNTVTSVAYLPFKYMSCTYEVVSYGNRPEARAIDKLSTSLFSPFLSKLGKEKYMVLDPQSADELSGVVHDLYEQIGGEHMISVMLKSEKDKCIGYVAFYKDKPVEEKDIDDLLLVGSTISGLLGVMDK